MRQQLPIHLITLGLLALAGCQHAAPSRQPIVQGPFAASQRVVPPQPMLTRQRPEQPNDVMVVQEGPETAKVNKDIGASKETIPPVLEPVKEPAATLTTNPPTELRPLCQALQAYLDDHPEQALEILGAYAPQDQELLLRLLPVIARVEKSGLLNDGSADEEKLNLLEVLRSLTREMQATAPLVIDKLIFSENAKTFGRVERRASSSFRPGDTVWLYVEIENLIDQRTPDGRYVTRLTSSLDIRQGDRQIKTVPVQSIPDWSWSPRTDHFSLIRFSMPRELEPGVYTLVVHITDQDTQRTADKSIAFRVDSFHAANRAPGKVVAPCKSTL